MGIFLLFITFVFQLNAYVLGDDPPFETNIVGGQIADIEDYPYQVAVIQDERLWCGGSIANPNYVLTAGHCVFMAIMPLFVHAGSRYWYNPGSVHEVDFNITYTTEISTTDDVALLHVVEPFVYDATHQAIPKLKNGLMGVVTGWGSSHDQGPQDELFAVKVPIIKPEICNRIFKDTLIGEIHLGEFCAGSYGKSSCQGDSGGPLVVRGRQAGIVSKGLGCSNAQYLTVYADITYFYEWITSHISE
ncbi:PREDICTED: trypsin epsilon-like [Ceratosolen solmsi marchali]|uniref:Trypsin epsilon-like n=1 Tax=Ceratosolen solmsi marchali TaxID=326594 RepID=A0AAJ6YQD4_9HYME|nr:PREDICTED: trypsin epsilon-like [Ceratosolen solmsi marchali]